MGYCSECMIVISLEAKDIFSENNDLYVPLHDLANSD